MPTVLRPPSLDEVRARLHQGQAEAALTLLKAIPRRDGAFFDLWGQAEELLGRWDRALAAYRQGATLRQTPATLHNNLGMLCRRLGLLDEARAHLGHAVRRRPEPRVLSNYALLHQAEGHLPMARAYLSLAHAMAPNDAHIHWNLAQVQLALGELPAGWLGYEMGLRCGVRRPTPQSTPRWDGAPVARLHVNAEQGLGDEILFSTCLEDARRRCDRLSWEADRRLIPLLERAHPGVRFVPRAALHVPAEAHCPMGSLPVLFRRRLEDFPRRATLRADPRRVARWRRYLADLGPGPKLGLSWAGGAGWERVKRRAPPSFWRALLAQPGIHWLDLQYDDDPQRGVLAGAGMHRPAGLDVRDDLESLAALLQASDGLVTLSNATAHLAAALGVRVFLVLPPNPGWRWFGEGTSPWYPRVHLFPHTTEGWDVQAKAVAAALAELSASS